MHDPHVDVSHPTLVPVSPSSLRKYTSSVRASTSAWRACPFTVMDTFVTDGLPFRAGMRGRNPRYRRSLDRCGKRATRATEGQARSVCRGDRGLDHLHHDAPVLAVRTRLPSSATASRNSATCLEYIGCVQCS